MTTARIPVVAAWDPAIGPLLSVGMLTAALRHHDNGDLTTRYEIHKPLTVDDAVRVLSEERGPAVLLCSDYLWSIDSNLSLARRVRGANPNVVVVHGGPSVPKALDPARAFLTRDPDAAQVLVRGEGESTVCELLAALNTDGPLLSSPTLRSVDGIAYLDPMTGDFVQTPDRPRIVDLNALASPYLTGEFDDMPADAWYGKALSIETNRGCPFGCTFCDWGSATNSRVRKFDVARVLEEVRWAVDFGVDSIQFCDANFGILARDVEIAEGVAALVEAADRPFSVAFTPAKNGARHLSRVFDHLLGAGVHVSTAISLQTTDPTTLDAVDRSNISTEGYLKLAADLRRRGQPLQGDLLLGLPGQTPDAYKKDLQFFFDHEIMPRTFRVTLLPNAPMNTPEYRERYGIEVGEDGSLVSTHSFDRDDRTRMSRLRYAETVLERYGLFRHPLRLLQWDYGIPAMDLIEKLIETVDAEPSRFPVISWVINYFDLHPTVPIGWTHWFEELAVFLTEAYGVDVSSPDLACVFDLQRFLMPSAGREFPATIPLAHDYVTYYREATIGLYTHGGATGAPRALNSFPPANFTVAADPLGLCETGLRFSGNSRDPLMEGDFHLGGASANELESPLLRFLPGVGGSSRVIDGSALAAVLMTETIPAEADETVDLPTAVELGQRPVRSSGKG